MPITCLDIGARHGVTCDIDPIAWVADLYGFEPDIQECERLNRLAAENKHPYHSLRYILIAIGGFEGERIFNLTRHRGTSSLLEPNKELRDRYARPDYFTVEASLKVFTTSLESAVTRYAIKDPAYIKIDIEGLEYEVLSAAQNLLKDSVLFIRTEIAFIQLKKGQALYGAMETFLRTLGFVPLGFKELHCWRRNTTKKFPYSVKGSIPFSKGEAVHGDMLFMKDTDALTANNDDEIKKLIKCAFFAMLYGYLDIALNIFSRPSVAAYIDQSYNFSVVPELTIVSKLQAQAYRKILRKNLWNDLMVAIGLK